MHISWSLSFFFFFFIFILTTSCASPSQVTFPPNKTLSDRESNPPVSQRANLTWANWHGRSSTWVGSGQNVRSGTQAPGDHILCTASPTHLHSFNQDPLFWKRQRPHLLRCDQWIRPGTLWRRMCGESTHPYLFSRLENPLDNRSLI
jgi:hypothetical protein